MWCLVGRDLTTNEITTFDPSNIHEVPDYLDQFDRIVGHNIIGYDLPVFKHKFKWEFKGVIRDSLVISRLCFPNIDPPKGVSAGPHSVEAWGVRFGRHKPEHEDWTRFSPEMLHRCSEDNEIQTLLYEKCLEEIKAKNWEAGIALACRVAWLLEKQREYGWTLDIPLIEKHMRTLNRWISKIDRTVVPVLPLVTEPLERKEDGNRKYLAKPFKKDGTYSKLTLDYFEQCGTELDIAGPFSRVRFRPIDLDKPDEVKDVLLAQGWQPREWNFDKKTGQRRSPKLNKDDDFEGINGKLGRLIAKRVQCRHRLSNLTTFRKGVREDGRIETPHSGFATTGRLKHSVVVNIPNPDTGSFFAKQMRSIFRAKEGWVMVGCDSKENQMRQLAARMKNEEFKYAVVHGDKSKGTDEHSLTMQKCGLDSRADGKKLNYTVIFGGQDPKVARTFHVSLERAKEMRRILFDGLPGLEDLINGLKTQWEKTAKKEWNPRYGRFTHRDGYIIGLDGRPIYIDSPHKLLVMQLQSDEAIQMAAAYCWAYRELEKKGYRYGEDYGFLIWYHDEFNVECRPEIAKDVAEILEESIAWAGRFFKIDCPHEGDAKIGSTWEDVH